MRSRGADGRVGLERDLIEAGLNEPGMAGSGYGDCVAVALPDGDGRLYGGGRKAMAPCLWARLEQGSGAAASVVGSGGAGEVALSVVWRDARAIWRPKPCDGMAAASKRWGLTRCLMLMGGEPRPAGLAEISGAAGCR